MPEVAAWRSALDSVGRPATVAGRDLWLRECAGETVIRLEGSKPGPALTGCLAALGVADLPAFGRSAGGAAGLLLPTGPATWLLLTAAPPPTDGAFDLALDVTGAWTRIAIGGVNAPALMAKGCALDLHPRAFPAGACAAAGFAGMRTIIRRDATQGFELLVGRSYALSLWQWLVDAAAEHLGEGPVGKGPAQQRRGEP